MNLGPLGMPCLERHLLFWMALTLKPGECVLKLLTSFGQPTVFGLRCTYIREVPYLDRYSQSLISLPCPRILHTVVSWKSPHGWSTLHCQKGRWALFWVFSHLTMKQCPCHVYSDLIPSKQTTGQTLMYNRAAGSFIVKPWQYTALWTAPWHCDHEVACTLQCISCVHLHKII